MALAAFIALMCAGSGTMILLSLIAMYVGPYLSCKIDLFCYHSLMDYSKIITIEPGKRSGKPIIRGTRMTVTDVLEYLAGGMSEAEILADFPDLTAEDIKACLAFAADRERKLAMLPEHETAV
jgi:uncharacterized protein (DUF433 family)